MGASSHAECLYGSSVVTGHHRLYHGMIITRMMNGDLMIITRMTIMLLTRLNIGEIMFGRISWTRMMFDSLARVTVPALHSLALESVAASQPAGEASAVPIRWTLAPGT